jgi:VWFA-related protein
MTRITTLLLFLVLASPTLPARTNDTQTPAQAPTQAPQAVFRSGVEIVRLDIRAVDGDGRPIKDLRPEEIEIYEAGQRRPLRLFQHVAEPGGSYLEIARRTIGGEVSTNQGAPRGHLYVIVFDQNHITPGNEQRARLAAERFLTTRIRPGDRVALYGLPGPGPQVAFSSNARAVAAELVRVRGSLDRSSLSSAGTMSIYEAYQVVRGDATVRDRIVARVTESAGTVDLVPNRPGQSARRVGGTDSPQALNQFVLDSARTVVDRADMDARAFLLNLADVIRELAAVEGRKSVVLISEGFYADNVAHEIELVAAAAARAYAAIYSLDVNRRSVDLKAEQPVGGEQFTEIQYRLESLGNLSADTDGELVPDAGSHIDQVMNRIADTLQDYYVLGFEPDARELSERDRYHRVTVKVLRPGVSVRARSGFALNDPALVADKRRAIDRALTAPFPQPGIPLEMTTYVLRGTSRGLHRVIVSAEAELPVKSANTASADVVFVVKDARDGRVTASGTDKMALPSGARPGRTTGVGRFSVQFETPAGEYLMRLAVREPGGTIGSVDRRFQVRPLDGVDVTASDLILGRRTGGLPVRAMARTDEAVNGVLEVYARRPADLDGVDVLVDLGRIGEEAAEISTRAELFDVKPLATGARRGAEFVLPLQGTAPGHYVVRATVKAAGETVAELTRELEVVPAGAAVEADDVPRSERVAPIDILSGEIGKNLVLALRASATDRAVVSAADSAAAGNWQKVEAALRDAAPGFGARVLQGLASFAFDRYDEAATGITRALAGTTTGDGKITAMVSFVLGWVHTYSGRELDAISAWRSAVLLDRTLVPAYLALADAYVRRSQPALAIQVLRGGLIAVPRSFEIEKKLREIEGK